MRSIVTLLICLTLIPLSAAGDADRQSARTELGREPDALRDDLRDPSYLKAVIARLDTAQDANDPVALKRIDKSLHWALLAELRAENVAADRGYGEALPGSIEDRVRTAARELHGLRGRLDAESVGRKRALLQSLVTLAGKRTEAHDGDWTGMGADPSEAKR